jgi:hypothetical protein
LAILYESDYYLIKVSSPAKKGAKITG